MKTYKDFENEVKTFSTKKMIEDEAYIDVDMRIQVQA